MIRIFLASLCFLASLQTLHGKDRTASDVGGAMAIAAQKFLASLDEEDLAKATMPFDDPSRTDWHNIPKPDRKGMQFHDMNAEQQELCHSLLRSALSESGYDKAVTIMSLENNLREGEKAVQGAPLRDPERYFLTIFGEPNAKGTWGWSFEGHHLSLNFVIREGNTICDTPSFWGANPATVKVFIDGGPAVGTRTLGPEEQLAFDLVNGLDVAQQGEAVIADKAPDDYRAAGQPQPPHTPPAGLQVAKMNQGQKKTLLSLLEAYNSHLHPSIAQDRLAAIKAAGLDRIHFAWAGATTPGVGHYYRVQGPTFVLELVNVQSDPAGNPANHIHSVWRSLQGDFAVPIGDAK
jgi:hypothetical protein